MPTLESISIKGFKSIRDVKVELRDINVLIGANGSGKSNFVGALSFLRSIRLGNLQRYVRRADGADRVLHFGHEETDEVSIRVRFGGDEQEYSVTLAHTASDNLYIDSEYVCFWDETKQKRLGKVISGDGKEAGIRESDNCQAVRGVRRHLNRWRLNHFSSTAPMKRTAKLHDNRYLRADGSNLAAFLYLLREKHEGSYRFMRNTVRLVAPFFDDFVLEPMALNEDTIRLEWKHKGTDAYFDVSSLSDGTLRFIALATLLQQPKELRPSVILLDDPELGLHPLAITMLASMVKSASVDTQVILATQSPILLDYFEPEDVLVADRVDGATEFTRLDSSKLAIWLEDYSIGELWEKNYLEGNPMPERRVSNQ